MANKDRYMPKQTRQEQFLHERIQKMRDEFEIRMLNIVAQVRAVAIAANVAPEKFIEAFHSDKQQNEYFNKQREAEKKIQEEYEAKKAKLSEEEKKMKEQLQNNEGLQNFMKDALTGPGEKII